MAALGSIDLVLEARVADVMRSAAQRFILPAYVPGQSIVADFKTPGEAVTEVDRGCESFLTDELSRLLPGVAVVGEEAVHGRPGLLDHLRSGTCWIVDPLDGTGNFANGHGPFGVLVALAEDGSPQAGWLLDPLSGQVCSAVRGHGARLDGARFRAARRSRPRPRVAVTSLFPNAEARRELEAALSDWCDVVPAPRCAADIYPRVAEGQAGSAGLDAALFTRTIAWDHAAGVVFLNEAGGRAARADGTDYVCGDAHAGLIAAADPASFERLAEVIAHGGYSLVHVPA